MMRRLKYLIAALLGFSTACSTVKQAPRSPQEEESNAVESRDGDTLQPPPRVMVMYGPRPPIVKPLAMMPEQSTPEPEEDTREAETSAGK